MPVRLGPPPGHVKACRFNYDRISANALLEWRVSKSPLPSVSERTEVDSTLPGNPDQLRRGILTNSASSFSLHSEIDLKTRRTRSP